MTPSATCACSMINNNKDPLVPAVCRPVQILVFEHTSAVGSIPLTAAVMRPSHVPSRLDRKTYKQHQGYMLGAHPSCLQEEEPLHVLAAQAGAGIFQAVATVLWMQTADLSEREAAYTFFRQQPKVGLNTSIEQRFAEHKRLGGTSIGVHQGRRTKSSGEPCLISCPSVARVDIKGTAMKCSTELEVGTSHLKHVLNHQSSLGHGERRHSFASKPIRMFAVLKVLQLVGGAFSLKLGHVYL